MFLMDCIYGSSFLAQLYVSGYLRILTQKGGKCEKTCTETDLTKRTLIAECENDAIIE
jgi:hypothetical protein